MNVGHRICCHAANAFRPGLALRNVFGGPFHRRCASTANLIAPKEGRDREGAVQDDVQRQENRSGAYRRLERHAEDLAAVPEGDLGHESHEGEEIGPKLEDFEEDVQPLEHHETDRQASKPADEDVLGGLHRRRHGRPRPSPDDELADFTSPKLAQIQRKKLARQEQEVLEYEGLYVKPIATQEKKQQRWFLPWMKGLEVQDKNASAYERMGAEVAAFGKWLRHTEAELATRESVIKQTMSIVKKAGTKFTVEPFGSARTGLGLASSDVDLRLFQAWDKKSEQASWMPKSAIPLPPKWKTRRQSLAALQALQTKFMRNPNYILCNIRFARYPLLHLQHAPSGLDVQIVCANDTTTQREWIDRQLTRRPHLADLYAVIKTMLDARGLTDVYRGGLGSYAIFSMIMVVLNKTAFDARTKGRVNSMNVVDMPKLSVSEQLGRDLESIFLFWARFDTYRHAVTVRPVGIWPKLDPDTIDEHDAVNNPLRILDKSQPYLLCLEDPNDPTNDLGRQAYGWKHIQQTIKSLSNGIRSGLESKQPEKIKSFLRNLVGTADSDYRTRRAFAEAYGAAAMKSPNGIPPRGSYVKPDNRGHLGTDYRKLIPATYSQDVSDNNSSNSGVDTEPPSSETEIAPQETPLATSEEDVNSVPAADGATSTPSAAEDLAQESRDTDEKAGAAAA